MGTRSRNPVLAALALTAAAACASCAHPVSGAPVAGPPTGATSATPVVTQNAAPPVRSPLDAGSFLTRPCSVLTADQLRVLTLPGPGDANTDEPATDVGPSCLWQNSEDSLGTSVVFVTANKNGLSDTYLGHEQGQFPSWRPTSVTGYPAVFNDVADQRFAGVCGLTVGISDTLAFHVSEADPRLETKACDRAEHVASLVIDTLRAEN